MKLTNKQKEILSFLEEHIEDNGAPPTRVEIAQKMGYKSPNAAEDHLKALNKKGAIELLPGTSRGIKINRKSHNPGIPVIGKVAAGLPILASENISTYHNIDSKLFHQKPSFMLQVTGDSMRDAGILDGDLIAVKPSVDVNNGDIVVARLDDEVTVKRIFISSDKVVLTPENDAFDPIEVLANQPNFAIEGLVVGLIRSI
ncbi:MAG: transcriptional repressor LexA [Francisellaceae bacterium]|jgi:repressor LexA|nr:transcriptional repressor LexA [Francisellaceae bacterium]MBT6539810.1 transcriptional repressor LexA [Francisellaceae bacterium]